MLVNAKHAESWGRLLLKVESVSRSIRLSSGTVYGEPFHLPIKQIKTCARMTIEEAVLSLNI